MKKQTTNIIPQKSIIRVSAVVGTLLLCSLLASFFVDGWNWGPLDFIVIGALLFGAGIALEFVNIKITNPIYRIIGITIIVLAFLTIWAELAVDAVSQLISLVI